MLKVRRTVGAFSAFIILLSVVSVVAFPRVWTVNTGTTGYVIASAAAQKLTGTLNPRNFSFCDDGGQAIWVDITGTAAASMAITLATAHKVLPQECWNVTFADQNVSNTFTVTFMTSAGTADYRIVGARP